MGSRLLLWSLLLGGVVVLAAGGISYWRPMPTEALWVDDLDPRFRVRATAVDGIIHIGIYYPRRTPPPNASGPSGSVLARTDAQFWQFHARSRSFGRLTAIAVGLPFWALAAPLVLVSAVPLARGPLRRRRRRRRGQCEQCGYPRAGLTVPRCPECGRPFDTSGGGVVAAASAAAPRRPSSPSPT
jgi:hypothetical protein